MTGILAGVWLMLLASEAVAPALGTVIASQMQAAALLAILLAGAMVLRHSATHVRVIPWRHGSLAGPVLALLALVLTSTIYRHVRVDDGREGWLAYAQLWDSMAWLLRLVVWAAACATLATESRANLLKVLTGVVSLCAGVYVLSGHALISPAVSALSAQNAWPLMNPNHSGVLFASALVLIVGSLSHRVVVWRQSVDHQTRARIWRHPAIWFALVQIGFLTAGIVLAGSFSALAVAMGGTVLLVLSDHYTQLDWVMQRAMDSLRGRQRWILASGLLLPMVLVIVTGITDLYRGSVVRLSIWTDSLRWLSQDPLGGLWGLGPIDFVDQYARMRSWHLGYPTEVLAPESELLYGLLAMGAGGLLAVGVALTRIPWTRLFSQRMGVLSHDWQARLALWALVVVIAQAMVDNTLHTLPMLFWAVMLASLSLRTIKAIPNS